jgi:hypothetical protein
MLQILKTGEIIGCSPVLEGKRGAYKYEGR